MTDKQWTAIHRNWNKGRLYGMFANMKRLAEHGRFSDTEKEKLSIAVGQIAEVLVDYDKTNVEFGLKPRKQIECIIYE